MRFRVGPSYRSYVIGQFIVIPGLLLITHKLVGIERDWIYIVFLSAVAILVAGLASWRKNEPLTAAGWTSLTTVIFFALIPWTMTVAPMFQSFRQPVNGVEAGIVIFGLLVYIAVVVAALGNVVGLPVRTFPDRWATPLWGQRRVPGTPKIRVIRFTGVGRK